MGSKESEDFIKTEEHKKRSREPQSSHHHWRYLPFSLWDPSLSKAVCDSIFLTGSPRLGSLGFLMKSLNFSSGHWCSAAILAKGVCFWKWVLVLEVWDMRFVEGFGGK